eukprot:CAMPEP_0114231460 /NCGR_PEP_ID=MMETSP0058-20121206/4056_1 /TAXON_ID=36894 /ORGANISM="Pyramimonas parkeae, CCMP726" /LENGTH=269 /DNA_ID=CAMNT_0001342811 /DNA_START=166 /DNA_END=972 /DNA_ORIENTATION=-
MAAIGFSQGGLNYCGGLGLHFFPYLDSGAHTQDYFLAMMHAILHSMQSLGAIASSLLENGMYAVMLRVAVGLMLSTAMAMRGVLKKSLSSSGALAAIAVGTVHMACGVRFGATLVAFYLSSSKLTKYQSDAKRRLEHDFKQGGQRNYVQVLANSVWACVVAALWLGLATDTHTLSSANNFESTMLLSAFLGHYSCCCGDTWASEVGVASWHQPRLVSTLKLVPAGTNGGVTLLGTAASVLGGAFTGASFFLFSAASPMGLSALLAPNQW